SEEASQPGCSHINPFLACSPTLFPCPSPETGASVFARAPYPNESTSVDARASVGVELAEANDDDPRALATRARDSALHTIGNLTIITGSLNTSVSHGPWPVKRQA